MAIELYNENNMQLMARYPDKYFDLAIVDPPYGIDINNQKQGKEIRCVLIKKHLHPYLQQ